VIAKVDATANDLEDIQISGYPTILYFTASHKKDPIKYEGDRSEADLFKFLEKYADNPWVSV
jgi:protein disulfide-isomerase A1